MKKICLLILLCLPFLAGNVFSQQPAATITFTAVNGTEYQPFDSILARNLSKECDTVLYYPDTVLTLGSLGIPGQDRYASGFRMSPNHPNPSPGQTHIGIWMPEAGDIDLTVTDLLGKTQTRKTFTLPRGSHQFTLYTGSLPACLFMAATGGVSRSLKITSLPGGQGPVALTYNGPGNDQKEQKTLRIPGGFSWQPGDKLLLVCYSDTLESGWLSTPAGNTSYTFQFAYNIPCPGMPEVEYEGQVYTTVQIFSQCWFKQNLNVGTMIVRTDLPSDNGTIEKYCYDDIEDSCTAYGAFYNWNEMMAYDPSPGSRGICPQGWHVPSDDEWNILEGAVESGFNIGDTIWYVNGVAGLDAGFNLKSTFYWQNDGNGSGKFGFDAPPIGYRDYFGYIYGFGHAAKYWSAGVYDTVDAWSRGLGCHGSEVSRFNESKENGFSVRCLKD